MKKMILIFLLGVIAGCGNQKTTSITGRYVLNSQSESSRYADTIVITPLNEKANVYYFVHHTGVRRMLNEKSVFEEPKRDSSLCVYDADKEKIKDEIYGKVYSVTEAGLTFTSEEDGSSWVYKRID